MTKNISFKKKNATSQIKLFDELNIYHKQFDQFQWVS